MKKKTGRKFSKKIKFINPANNNLSLKNKCAEINTLIQLIQSAIDNKINDATIADLRIKVENEIFFPVHMIPAAGFEEYKIEDSSIVAVLYAIDENHQQYVFNVPQEDVDGFLVGLQKKVKDLGIIVLGKRFHD